ncbi:hypothetical protein FHR55_001306 [Xanthomonas arboricola]
MVSVSPLNQGSSTLSPGADAVDASARMRTADRTPGTRQPARYAVTLDAEEACGSRLVGVTARNQTRRAFDDALDDVLVVATARAGGIRCIVRNVTDSLHPDWNVTVTHVGKPT